MKRINCFKIYLILAIVLFVIPCYGVIYYHEASARSAGMGGSFYTISDDPAVMFYNPAGIAGIEDITISGNYTIKNENTEELYIGYNFISGVFIVVPLKHFNIGFGYSTPIYWRYNYEYNSWGEYLNFKDSVILERFTVSFGVKSKNKIRFGLNLNYNHVKIDESYYYSDWWWVYSGEGYLTANVINLGLGLQVDFSKRVSMGLMIKNGLKFEYNQKENNTINYPDEIYNVIPPEAALSVGFNFNRFSLSIMAHYIYWSAYSIDSSSYVYYFLPTSDWLRYGLGFEWDIYKEKLFIRGGYKENQTDGYVTKTFKCLGIGIKHNKFRFDFSYEKVGFDEDFLGSESIIRTGISYSWN